MIPRRAAKPLPPPPKTRIASREGKRGAQVWLEPEAVKQLNHLAINEGSSVQSLMEEAVGMLFVHRHLPRMRK